MSTFYNGYELQMQDVAANPNGQQTQTVLIFKDGVIVGASYADLQFENAIVKAKSKIDKYNSGN